MKKNIIIIVVVALVILIVGLLLVLSRNSSKKTAQENIQTSSPIPVLPEFSNSDVLSIKNSGNAVEIKNQFQKISSENTSDNTRKEGIKWFLLKDKDSKVISLEDFLKASEAKIYPKVENLLDKYNYKIFYCPDTKGKKDFGIALYVNSAKFFPNRYSDIMAGLKEWEKTILPDFHSVIYPNYNFGEKDLGQKIIFKDGKYRYAEIILPDGGKSSINYENFGDAVVITTSVSCMDKVSSLIAPLEK